MGRNSFPQEVAARVVNSELGIMLVFGPSQVILSEAAMPLFWDLAGWSSNSSRGIVNSGLGSMFEVGAVGIISRRADRYLS